MKPEPTHSPSLIPFSENNHIRLVPSGEGFLKSFLEMVNKAQDFILLQTYILREDRVGHAISKALRQARRRNVEVFLLLDAYGSNVLSDDFLAELRISGIRLNFFNPVFNMEDLSLGRRLHHKILLIDNCEVLVGGINLGTEYIYDDINGGPFMDLAVWLKGDAVIPIVEICRTYFNYAGPHKMLELPRHCQYQEQVIESRKVRARASLNDAMNGINNIGRNYNRAIEKAKFSIDIMSGYFYPSRRMLRRLEQAAKRGVKVRLILPGRSDVLFAQWATHTLYDHLLKHGVEIYEWTKSVLHGKAAVVDIVWSTVGSYNLHYTSRLGNVETNIEIVDGPFAAELTQKFNQVIKTGTRQIHASHSRTYPWYYRLRDWMALLVAQAILLLSIFLAKGKRMAQRDV